SPRRTGDRRFLFASLPLGNSFVIRDSKFVIVRSRNSKTTMLLDYYHEQEYVHEFCDTSTYHDASICCLNNEANTSLVCGSHDNKWSSSSGSALARTHRRARWRDGHNDPAL